MSLEQTLNPKLGFLKDRALMLSKARSFFFQREVLEIDCPILNEATNIDDHIDPIEATYLRKKGYLHTSPELFLKKLLAQEGCEDLYFLGHVFRDHEKGAHHHVEFTMVEWYRKNLSFEELIDETLEFIQLFVSPQSVQKITYCDALYQATGLDTQASKEELIQYIHTHLDPTLEFEKETSSDLLIFIFAQCVEPNLDKEKLTVIYDYPKGQSALAKIKKVNQREVAKRFEVYYQGVELANGYDELTGSRELKFRYLELNKKRICLGKEPLKIDEDFIEANEKLPDCRGVAVGFDRLMMLKANNRDIHQSMALLSLMP